MPSATPWRPLSDSRDASIPKLHNLALAARRGFRVPPTYWASAGVLESSGPHPFPDLAGLSLPCIVRSGSPTEDTGTTSNAGQYLSLPVDSAEDFPQAVAEVIAALPREGGRPRGAVFLQPLVDAESAGVTFFDGFYFEETVADGGNARLTAGRDRGEVRRGHLMRGDARSLFLQEIHRVFGGRLDIEWAIPRSGPWRGERVLLQVRPALFPIRRCETLSLANHKEILGDPPSPWMTGVLAEVGHPIISYLAPLDPALRAWDEPYAIEIAERAWMNYSVFFRLMDHWGLPRTLVSEGVGGEAGGPLDGKILPARFASKVPRLVAMAFFHFRSMWRIKSGLRAIDADLDGAQTLLDLQRANVRALAFSICTNFAIIWVLSVATKVRHWLGFRQAARVITHAMMARYAEIASRPKLADRLAGLDQWLELYGHRGPLESDPCRPRFSEMREELRESLSAGPSPAPRPQPQPSRLVAALGRPLFVGDEVREWFRDQLMHWWGRLRLRILEEARLAVIAGHLDAEDDVFFLRSEDLAASPATWRDRVAYRKTRVAWAERLDLPTTASRDEIQTCIADREGREDEPDPGLYRGIGLGIGSVVGTVVVGTSVAELLNGRTLPEAPILVAECLEPSWAVLFPRFAAVVADLGGELSHAAILLREAGIPSVVNARGAFRAMKDGDTVRVDPADGSVEVVARAASAEDLDRFSLLNGSS